MSTSGGFSKAAARAKAKGLTIKTNFTIDSTPPTIKNGDAFANIATAPPRKYEFDVAAGKPPAPKRSEALLNSDWRNNRRHRSDSSDHHELLTAPPDKLRFTQEEIKAPKKKLKVDTSIAQTYGLRRYRESPIDPDFIFSAPATKQEFLDAYEEDTTPSSGKESFEIIESQGGPGQKGRSLVRLDALPYHTRQQIEEIINWDAPAGEPSPAGVVSDWDSSAIAVTPCESADRSNKEPGFPFAEIHAVKNSKRLHTVGWDGIDSQIRKTLEKLIEPRTAGLPVDKLRDEYQQGQDALAKKTALDDSLIKNPKAADIHNSDDNQDSFQKTKEEQIRFDALIGKLQKSAASRHRVYGTTTTSSSKLSPVAKNIESDARLKLDESVKTVDVGLATEKPLTKATVGTSLNPKASEFFSTTQNQQQQQLECTVSVSQNSQPSNDVNTKDTKQGPTMQELLSRIEELEAQVKGQSPEKPRQHISSMQPNLTQNFSGDFAMRMVPQAAIPIHTRAQELGISVGLAGPGVNATAPGMALPILPQQMAINHGGMQPPGVDHHDNMPVADPTFHHGFNARGPVAPVLAPVYPGMHPARPNLPGHAAFPPQPDGASLGQRFPQQHPGVGSTPMIARNMFGPKPVRKPKGPFRPGDPQQAMHQQQYEEYLEWLRHNDPEYAQKCKARQARRAQRQRSGQDQSEPSDTAKLVNGVAG
ncbi:hypothetical protein F4810DRAFT_365032 [Camillea tinctor]|nr:hypothetical protein F4810DRAFT_365032 [Camillea tinctor]